MISRIHRCNPTPTTVYRGWGIFSGRNGGNDVSAILYHWTHRNNLESIIETGLDPSYSEGRLKAVWVCGRKRINWALWHVATRHGWDADDMVLIRVVVDRGIVKRTCNADVYNVFGVIALSAGSGVRTDPVGEFEPVEVMRARTVRDDR